MALRAAGRLSAVVLCLVLAPPAAAGEAASTSTTVAPSTTQPPTELGPDTPRGAMIRFLAAAREGHYARAAEYLDLSRLPRSTRAQRGPELARELGTVLDRALWVDPNHLSDQPEGDTTDGLPPFRDSLGTIETPDGPVEIIIERVNQPGGPVWKIAGSTVAAIPTLYQEYGWGILAKLLPAPFFELRFLTLRLWQWIGLILLVWASTLVAWLVTRIVVGLSRRLVAHRGELGLRIAEYGTAPLRLAVAVAAFAMGLPYLALVVPAQRFFLGLDTALAIIALTWGALRALDVLASGAERRLVACRHVQAVALLPLVRRSIKVFIAIVAGIAALQNFGFNVTGLLAGLGVGGLAVALAAQKTVENLFGSVSLVADQPVRVGDICRFGDTVGRVEDIGLRSTRLRTVDRDTLVTIPNGQFSTFALENLSRRTRLPVRATITLPPSTNADRIREVLEALRALLADEPTIEHDSARVRFTRMAPQGYDLEFFAFVLTGNWNEFVEIRERVFLRTLDAVGTAAASLTSSS